MNQDSIIHLSKNAQNINKTNKRYNTFYLINISIAFLVYALIEMLIISVQKLLMCRKKDKIVSALSFAPKIFSCLNRFSGHNIKFETNGYDLKKKSIVLFSRHAAIIEEFILGSKVPSIRALYSEMVIQKMPIIGRVFNSLLLSIGMIPCDDSESTKIRQDNQEYLESLLKCNPKYIIFYLWYHYHGLLPKKKLNIKDPDRIINAIKENLKNKKNLMIFPEGKRNENLLHLLLKENNREDLSDLSKDLENFHKFFSDKNGIVLTNQEPRQKISPPLIDRLMTPELLGRIKCMPKGVSAILESFFSDTLYELPSDSDDVNDKSIPLFFNNIGNVYGIRSDVRKANKTILNNLLIECGALIKKDKIEIISSGFKQFLNKEKIEEYVNAECGNITNEKAYLESRKLEFEKSKKTEGFEYEKILYKFKRMQALEIDGSYEKDIHDRIANINIIVAQCNEVADVISFPPDLNTNGRAQLTIAIIDMLFRLYEIYDLEKIVNNSSKTLVTLSDSSALLADRQLQLC